MVGPTPTDPAEFRECARDARMLSAAKKHTNEGQGGGRNPGVKRPDAGRGQSPAHSKILSCRNAGVCLFSFDQIEYLLARSAFKIMGVLDAGRVLQ